MNYKERGQLIEKMYASGCPVQEIADAVGRHRATVHTYLRLCGLTASLHGGRVNPLTTRIATLYSEGGTYSSVALEIGMSVGAVRHHLKKAGIKSKRKGLTQLLSTEAQLAVCEMVRKGATKPQTAEAFNVSVSTVYRILNKYL